MKHILVYAYQLHPFKGSECGLAWDYVINMSRTNKLTVLYGTCEGYHDIGNTSFLEDWVKDNPIKNVTLIPVKPSFQFTPQGYGLIGICRFYRQYKQYQGDVLKVAKSILKKEKIDIIHFLGPIGYHEPGLLWQLPCPYIWGPLGGVVSYDTRLLWNGSLDKQKWLFARIKKLVNDIKLRINGRVKTALYNSDLVLGCTTETVKILHDVFGLSSEKLSYFPQNCIKDLHSINESKFNYDVIEIVWIGRLDNFKSLITVLRSLKLCSNKSKLKLNVIGSGVLENKLQSYVNDNGLQEVVKFYGNIDRQKVWSIINNSHLHIITSLHDANPTVFWEAMSYCVPTLSLANCGLEDIIIPEIGYIIPITNYKTVVAKISEILQSLTIKVLLEKAENINKIRGRYSWMRRAAEIEKQYEMAINNYNSIKNNQ